MKALLIPIKDPTNAKSRLSDLLSADERRRLAWAMFEDVSRAVTNARNPDRVVMVTSYPPAIERARVLGWDVLIEESQISESASVDWASRILSEQGFETVMRLPADLPLVRGEDIDALLAVDLAAPGALLVPSRDGMGTNAIIRTPPTLFPSRFGPNSLELHKSESARVGVECAIVNNLRVALDIDELADLHELLECGLGPTSVDAIIEMHVLDRINLFRRKDSKGSQRTQGR
jgi:2-phospho-L-lactate/phosphoenolpyruvate guanylyltransferase